MGRIKLIDVTKDNWLKICLLNPGKQGADYVAPNAFSIAESVYSNEGHWIVKGIADGEELIGFTMYGYNAADDVYDMCRLMLDQNFQGKGYGQEALKIIVKEMAGRFVCAKIYLSTTPANLKGKYIYEKFGFINTGEIVDGEELFVYHLK